MSANVRELIVSVSSGHAAITVVDIEDLPIQAGDFDAIAKSVLAIANGTGADVIRVNTTGLGFPFVGMLTRLAEEHDVNVDICDCG